MNTHTEIAPHLATLTRALGNKVGTEVSEEDLRDEFAKYLEYGVPVDQAIKVILRHHGVQTAAGPPVPTTEERLQIANLPATSPYVNMLARFVTVNVKTVQARGEEKEIVWGLLGDETGTVPYTSWRPLEGVEKGDVFEIEGAYTKEWNGAAQVNFGDRTKFRKLDAESIPNAAPVAIQDVRVADIREGMRGLRVKGRILHVAPREITLKTGESKTLWGGAIADASGSIEFTSWADHNLTAGAGVVIAGGYVRSFRGVAQLNFDNDAVVTATDDVPTLDDLGNGPAMEIAALLARGGGNDVTVEATLLEVRDGSGLVFRCGESGCSRVLVSGQCRLHNKQTGTPDLRIKGVLDDGTGAVSVIVGRELTEALLGKDLEACKAEAQAAFRPDVICDQLRHKLTARVFKIIGNAIADDYGMMLIARAMDRAPTNASAEAAKILEAL